MLTSPAYRPDIDGLRALAVVAVIAFHTFPRALPGGFTGVDVFFVISGYLITLIIIASLEAGSFRFTEFYARRIRRIFPALIVVLASTLALGWFVLLPEDYRQLGKHLAAAAAFLSNFALLREAGYFDASAETKPLLHLWSLAIEEQFYLLWPLLVATAWRWRHVAGVIAAIGLISFAANILMVGLRPEAAFYSPLSRFWELMAGGALAYLAVRGKGPPPALQSILSISGALLVVAGMTLIDGEARFPGWWALLPVAGTFLLIWSGRGAWVNRMLLGRRPMVYIGRISYPLYLWHWCLLVLLAMHTFGDLGAAAKVAIVTASFLLSVLTYRYIETPIRSVAASPGKLVSAMAALLVLGLSLYLANGKPERFSPAQLAVLDHFDHTLPAWHYFERHRVPATFRDECNFYDIQAFRYGRATRQVAGPIAQSCHVPNPGKKTVLLWGDSHAQQLNHGLTRALPPDWQVLQIASSGCNPDSARAARASSDYCEYSNGFALERIEAIKPDVVMLAQEGGHRLDKFRETAAELRRRGAANVLVIGPVPHWKPMLYKILAKEGPGNLPRHFAGGLDHGVLKLNSSLARSISDRDPMRYVDIVGFFCDSTGCLTYIGDDAVAGLTTFDYGHLTAGASVMLAEGLLVPLILRTATTR